MAKYIEAGELPADEKIYFKKDMLGWRIVHPYRNPNGTYNWINLFIGGWRNFLTLVLILLIAGFVMWSYNHDVQAIQENYGKIADNPLGWCHDICTGKVNPYEYSNITFNLQNP